MCIFMRDIKVNPTCNTPTALHAHAHSACLHARMHTKTLPCMLQACMHDHTYIFLSGWHACMCIFMRDIKVNPTCNTPTALHAHAHSACLHARMHTKTLPWMLQACMHDHTYIFLSGWHA